MVGIQLLAVDSALSRKKNAVEQTLTFWLRVDNLAYHKQVDVLWAGSDGVWHSLAAEYFGECGDGGEYWRARAVLHGKTPHAVPGNVRFALRLRCGGSEYWDNNAGSDYTSPAGSGLCLAKGIALQNLFLQRRLKDGQQWLTVKVAVDPAWAAEKLTIHWTVDDWLQSRQTPCHRGKQGRLAGAQVWSVRLKVADVFRLQYCICASNAAGQVLWDNNGGKNYRLSRKPLTVMILNLHCYQEDRQDHKFSQIAKAIDEQAVDVVCFQEVAEHWNHGHGDWLSNSANIINHRLKRPMHIYTDWSHLGFDKYREGVAILSRYPLHRQQSRYVSDSHDAYSIHSRKVVAARIEVPCLGVVNVFSAHLSWWEDGFRQQFQRLCDWADSLSDGTVAATLLCGDFNITAGTIGYRQVVGGGRYQDQYLAANHQGLFDSIFRVDDPHWRNYPADDYRIDYIFMNKDAGLQVTAARVLFTEQDYGRVSDHCGYLMCFEPKVMR